MQQSSRTTVKTAMQTLSLLKLTVSPEQEEICLTESFSIL
jgi:hypothetical protein